MLIMHRNKSQNSIFINILVVTSYAVKIYSFCYAHLCRFEYLRESGVQVHPKTSYVCIYSSVLADVPDGDAEVEPSLILVNRGSAELLPKQKHIKMERMVPTTAGVGEGGMTCNFTVGQ
jgi:hypothetical protein